MQKERKVAVVIQARMNSQRVPNKMVRPFAGTSLFRIALEKLEASSIPNEDIVVSIGEDELFEIAADFMMFRRFYRSTESCDSTNDPNKPDSLTLLYEWHRKLILEGYTHVILVSACNPLLSVETIDRFYEAFTNSELDGMFSVVRKYNYYWDENCDTITDWKGMKLMNTRKVSPTYEGAHCLYGSKLSFIADECWMGDTSPPKPELFMVDGVEATDIDTMEDFKIAEVLYKHFILDGES